MNNMTTGNFDVDHGVWAYDPEDSSFYRVVHPFYRFFSYNRRNGRCVAYEIIRNTLALLNVGENGAEALFESGLSPDFRPGGVSSWLFDTTNLQGHLHQLIVYRRGHYLTQTQARKLAQLGVALLDYEMRHLDDDTNLLFYHRGRFDIERMIKLVDPTLLDELLPFDRVRYQQKLFRERERARLRTM